MAKLFIPKTDIASEIKSYLTITIGLIIYAISWNFFMSPFQFLIGGVTGIGAIIQYSVGISMQYTYFCINVVLIIIAIWQLGFKFCIKTIYAIIMLTLFLSLFQEIFK